MDVTFTNVLEGARQYFQGLPAGTNSTVSPTYSEVHSRTEFEPSGELPPSSNSYWSPQPNEPIQPPSREHTPVQRPASHNSDSSRHSHSQYTHNASADPSRSRYPGSYQEQYQQRHVQQQQHNREQQNHNQVPQMQQPQFQHQNYQHLQQHQLPQHTHQHHQQQQKPHPHQQQQHTQQQQHSQQQQQHAHSQLQHSQSQLQHSQSQMQLTQSQLQHSQSQQQQQQQQQVQLQQHQPHLQQQLQHPQQQQQQQQQQHPQHHPQQQVSQQHSQQPPQTFQFPRPHSREAPSNTPQYQPQISNTPYHQPSSPYNQPPSPYHQAPSPYNQIPSPQMPRVPSKEQLVPRVPSRESSLPRVSSQEQLVPRVPSREHLTTQYPHSSETVGNGYLQQRSYYPQQSQNKSPHNNNNNMLNPVTHSQSSIPGQSFPIVSQHQSVYYKHIYTSQTQQAAHINTRPSNTQEAHCQNTQLSSSRNMNLEQGFRTTHNLPPIASISNYHSSRTVRDSPTRSIVNNTPRTRTHSSTTSTINISQQNYSVANNSSIIQQNPVRSLPHSQLTTVPSCQNYRYLTPQQPLQNTTTVTTQSYSQVIMTSSNSNNFSASNQSQSSTHPYLSIAKSNTQEISRTLPSMNPPVNQHVDSNQNSRSVIKRESPLDLSVKTVRTPADSTLGDIDNDTRTKTFQTSRSTTSSIATHSYPTLDVNSINQNLTRRSSQISSATAPKFEFRPNFNVPSLNQSRLPKRPVEDTTSNLLPERAHSSSRNYEIKNDPYSITNSRYPPSSIPTAAHANSYVPPQHVSPKTYNSNVPNIPVPPISSYRTNNVYSVQSTEVQKKRPGDMVPSTVPNKIPKVVDSWKQKIDKKIDEKFSSYKQEQQAKYAAPPIKLPVNNGTYSTSSQERTNEMYSMYKKSGYENISHTPYISGQYPSQNNHNQTYVPSPATHQYPGYTSLPTQHSQLNNSYLHPTSRSNSNPSLNTLPGNKNSVGGADKRVLSLLRNSLEVKAGQKKLEQQRFNENFTQHIRSDIQQPSTDVTAPLQPKLGLMGRNNVSPFTPTNFPDNSNMTLINKFHIPKAVDSVNFETNKINNPVGDKQSLDTVISSNANSDYDGLAALVAARIRTKGELKQGGPAIQNATNTTSASEIQLHTVIENQLMSPMKQDILPNNNNSGININCSSPKMIKDRTAAFAPRKRLFSRNEEEYGHNVPPRDKSGLRSSSETSVFDFPDSDSETDMAGKESLEAMRKGRRFSKQGTPLTDLKTESPSRPLSPNDDIFAQLCDNFVEQLKSGVVKKKMKKKKCVEPEVLAQLETVTKENPLENIDNFEIIVNIKKEQEEHLEQTELVDDIKIEGGNIDEKDALQVQEKTDTIQVQEETKSISPVNLIPKLEIDLKSTSDSEYQENSILFHKKQKVRKRLLSTSESENDIEDTKQNKELNETIKLEQSEKIADVVKDIQEEHQDTVKDDTITESPQKQTSIIPISRPVKKPSFGDGSDFYPGWEEGVYKYKKSLRIPPTLIQVTRPPQFHRLSTSLPDLDPCPQSPTSSITNDIEKDSKSKFKKVKSESLDSENDESNSSFNIFSRKTNYDSEGSASIKSLPNTGKETSILDKLLEKCGGRKKRKYKKRDDQSPKVIPKAENPVELLPTPSLEIKEEVIKEKNLSSSPVIKTESALLGFRKTTINNFKDAFIKSANNIVGVNEQFTTVVMNSRTRKQTRVLKQRATIKEVFGEDRPASAPPVTCINDIHIKEALGENSCLGKLVVKLEKRDVFDKVVESRLDISDRDNDSADTKQVLKNKLLNKGKKKEDTLLKILVDKKIKTEIKDENDDDERILDDIDIKREIDIKRDVDEKSETPSIDGDEGSISGRRKGKFGKGRRKLSSGFDYLKKKKKIKKEPPEKGVVEKKKKNVVLKAPESIDDIQKEIKTWVLNKGIGETHLHRAARLGYTDITAYCLEKMESNPSPKDNAGYTPLHEACARGHLQIAKLLLLYGANPSESAQGGIRPLHEAIENGFVEIVRLLLSYGADPNLATYTGLTPLALTNDETTKDFLNNHLNDVQGQPSTAWVLHGPASCFDPIDYIGYNVLDDVPDSDQLEEEEDIEIEVSEAPLPNLYILQNEPASDRWILLQDLSNLLKIKSRDALLKQICPPSTSSSTITNKTVLRELKMSDFLQQGHCCQFVNAGEKINTRASKIALVKYTDRVKELLNVEVVTITTR